MSRLKQVNLQVYSIFLYQSTFVICWKNAYPSLPTTKKIVFRNEIQTHFKIESRFDFLKTIFLVVGKLGEAFFQQIMKVLWYRNTLYNFKLTCFNLLIVKIIWIFSLNFSLNLTLCRQATRLTFMVLMRSIIYHRKAPNVLFHVYLNHFSYFSKLTRLLAND